MVDVVGRLVRGEYRDEAEGDRLIDELVSLTGQDHVVQLIFWPGPGEEDLTPEQIVDAALRHRAKPIAL